MRGDLAEGQAGFEACDDGNQLQTDACLNDCVAAQCGDGFVQENVEACDDANNAQTDECLNNCSSPTCGDGFVRAGVEACDDGNQDNNDGCSNACTENRRPCSVVAAAWCTAKGWRVAGGAQGGNIVCTVDGRGTGNNCDTCSTYNIIVWRNGSKERHCDGHNYSTRAGTFYSAHTPCRCGDNLDACGQWDMQNCIPD